jgi:hypothetical protein
VQIDFVDGFSPASKSAQIASGSRLIPRFQEAVHGSKTAADHGSAWKRLH